MKVERLPDSKYPWVTSRDLIAHQLNSGANPVVFYGGEGANLASVRKTVDALVEKGYGRGVSVKIIPGSPPNSVTGKMRKGRFEPWTGEFVPV